MTEPARRKLLKIPDFSLAADRVRDGLELLLLSMRLQGGRRFWVMALLPLGWLLFHVFREAMGWVDGDFGPQDAQNLLIGLPLTLLAIGLGIQIIAGEIEERTLEVCYTVPGGASRIWFTKLAGAVLLVTAAQTLLAAGALYLTDYPLTVLYGAWQGAVFYLVLSMALGAMVGNKLSAGLFAGGLLALNGFATGFGGNPTRYSPLFNPLAVAEQTTTDAAQILAWTIQNRIGVALGVGALLALTLARAERREVLLSEGG